MKKQYNVGDIVVVTNGAHNHEYNIGLISDIEKHGTPHVVSINWGDSYQPETYTTDTINSWISTNNAKHYQVVE